MRHTQSACIPYTMMLIAEAFAIPASQADQAEHRALTALLSAPLTGLPQAFANRDMAIILLDEIRPAFYRAGKLGADNGQGTRKGDK